MRHVLPMSWAEAGGRAEVGGVPAADLAARFGTPLVVIDERHVESRLAAFRAAFGPAAELAYAGKAFLCGRLVRLLDRAGWLVDVVAGGELELVRRAGFPMDRVVLHGNAKSPTELRRAVECGVGRVVVDHAAELDGLRRAVARAGSDGRPRVLVRLNVNLDPGTHQKITTVGLGAHFGMPPAEAAGVVRAAKGAGVAVTGVHIHAGSQIRELATFARVAGAAVDFVEPLRDCFPRTVELDLGGGLAAPYRAAERVPTPEDYAAALRDGLAAARAEERLGAYRLIVEPGRSVIANAGVTLYSVQAHKRLLAPPGGPAASTPAGSETESGTVAQRGVAAVSMDAAATGAPDGSAAEAANGSAAGTPVRPKSLEASATGEAAISTDAVAAGPTEALAVDGGLSDNPRPALYGAGYEVINASRTGDGPRKEFRVVGRHCESGDIVASAAVLPEASAVGDVLAVPATGAYTFAMSSRYNGTRRPAVVFVRDGATRLVVRRETEKDLLACDLDLPPAPLAAEPERAKLPPESRAGTSRTTESRPAERRRPESLDAAMLPAGEVQRYAPLNGPRGA